MAPFLLFPLLALHSHTLPSPQVLAPLPLLAAPALRRQASSETSLPSLRITVFFRGKRFMSAGFRLAAMMVPFRLSSQMEPHFSTSPTHSPCPPGRFRARVQVQALQTFRL